MADRPSEESLIRVRALLKEIRARLERETGSSSNPNKDGDDGGEKKPKAGS